MFGSRVADEQVEYNRFYGVSHKYYCKHAYDGDERERMQGGMLGKDHGSHTHHRGKCWEEYGGLVRIEELIASHVAILQPVHNEDAEIVAYTKDKCREYDVDDIKAYIEQSHYSYDNNPADTHGQEADEC